MNEFQRAVGEVEGAARYLSTYSGHISYRVDPEFRRIALLRIEKAREALATIERCIKEGTDK